MAEIFSDEFFGFLVPDYPSIPAADGNSVINSLARVSVGDPDYTPTGSASRFRPTSEPVEHDMTEVHNSDVTDGFTDHESSPPRNLEENDPEKYNIDIGFSVNRNDDCECKSTDTMNDDILKSSIEFQLTRSHKENGGFSLTSSRSSGHIIDINDTDNSHVRHMRLQTGDTIIGIKNVDVRPYEHHVLVSILQHIYGEDSGVFKMVIGRNFKTDDTGKTEVRYIEINVMFEFPTRGETILRMSVDIVTCTSLSFTKIVCVEFQDFKTCWIRNNGRYLSVQNDQLTTNELFTSRTDTKFQFQWLTFHGLEARTRNNRVFPAILFCAFQPSVNNAFITVLSGNRVGLGGSTSLRRSMTAVRKPDCRFFKVRLISEESYLLESLVYENVYLCSGKRGLSMRRYTSDVNDVFSIPRELKFEILTSVRHALT
ncbi:uncharacterized protein LOC117342269 [Pecten maximus]|uniref:uncharacterized protein LOC117342269 n=1 Tax=Pecten maximus TaxID=6579 RepID=UPI0014586951|nr:uncharacterized protein LOC117342269 [Pecten maximus]XP_033760250.1 uncharacterized protein LOC117342269 [Pecten maximus]